MTIDILKRECRCGHHRDTHYKDPQTGERWACTGLHCDCAMYNENRDRDTPLLPPNNYDESKTAAGGGRPHVQCNCRTCLEWEWEQISRQMQW